ncbi:carboxylesterase [Steroidobacter agaridevorans]|uniref:Carboxylesterase n=1 Tax=Steroidobacter agaridevorans TaxID=2695856 RepID=A0A829Y528_9GAMM|nr:alpha/beta fold hydrolase [Steroidobacter agaridevorans]GFE78249.1 carboxylesterase [Steroidobacter agaridevorans]GFE91306.1 carboxylesterase [Steroidobacter agaridevorans]
MPYTTRESADAVVLTPAAPAAAAVIWLHGLGADGFDFVPIVDELRLPATLPVRFIFPHAAPRPVTINNGYVMRAWYDIKGFGPERAEDDAGIRESEGVVQRYIEQEIAQGIPASKIVIAGFSQGGAIALQTALRYQQRLAGVMALSTYLPLAASLSAEASDANRDVPILMCHGVHDPVVPVQMGEASRDALKALDYLIEWRTYPMEHSVCMEEVLDLSTWLQARLA